MKVLITGGAGFIGSHLAEAMVGNGDDVTVLDNLSTGSLDNLQPIKGNKRLRVVIDDVVNEEVLDRCVEGQDVVFHLAAAVGVRLVVEKPVHTIEVNVHGTETVLRACRKYNARVLLASTSEVYGKSTKIPFHEDDDIVLGPTYVGRWGYACSKAIDEYLGLAYFREYGLQVTVARLFNTVGPRQTGRYGMVIPNFVRRALAGEDVLVHGNGEQTRCFAHVYDTIRALQTLAASEKTIGTVFNVGNNEEVSITSLAERCIAQAGSDSSIRYIPYEQVFGAGFEDMKRRVPSIDRVREVIGWTPEHNLERIIADVDAHIRTTGRH